MKSLIVILSFLSLMSSCSQMGHKEKAVSKAKESMGASVEDLAASIDKQYSSLKKACDLSHAKSCFELAGFHKIKSSNTVANNLFSKACSLGYKEAC